MNYSINSVYSSINRHMYIYVYFFEGESSIVNTATYAKRTKKREETAR